MTSIVDSVFRGSYKGLPFVMERGTTVGGRKYSKKEYPNRDDQNIQDLGLRPRSYEINIIINASSPDNYIAAKEALLNTLELGGSGTLVHPLFGSIPNMSVLDWTLVEDMAMLGEGKIVVIFEPDASNGIPTQAALSLSSLTEFLEIVNNNAATAFVDQYVVNNSLFGVATTAISKTEEIVEAIRESVSFIGETTINISSLTQQLEDLETNVNVLIQNPTGLATSLQDAFEDMWNVFTSPSDNLNAFENMFDTGSDDVVVTTVGGPGVRTINTNNAALNVISNTNILTGAYNSAVQIENTTVSEVDAIAERLDDQYDVLIEDPTVDPALKADIIDARVLVVAFLNQLRLIAAEEVDVYVQTQPARIISFNYYNDSTRGDEIASINMQPDLSFISGDITILSD